MKQVWVTSSSSSSSLRILCAFDGEAWNQFRLCVCVLLKIIYLFICVSAFGFRIFHNHFISLNNFSLKLLPQIIYHWLYHPSLYVRIWVVSNWTSIFPENDINWSISGIYLNWKLIFRFLWVTFSSIYAKSWKNFILLYKTFIVIIFREKHEDEVGHFLINLILF